MSQLYNIYCDESCHLESDGSRYMVIGGVQCPNNVKGEIFSRIKEIRKEHGLGPFAELKWTKVSKRKLDVYKDVIKYFFDKTELSFRCVVIDKSQLDHSQYNHTHDDFYYKMYFRMLEWFMEPNGRYNVYLDIKDTQGAIKTERLHTVLANSQHDFNREIVDKIQEVRSHEIVTMQLVDLLIGAIAYANRFPEGGESEAKNELVNLIKQKSNYTLTQSTLLGAKKMNIFHWESR